MNDTLRVVPYDPAWPRRFTDEATRLAVALRPLAPRVEHIGSTSVPGLAAKPIIDIMIGVAALAPFMPFITPLQTAGYEYLPHFETTLPERRFLRRVDRGERTHHVHVVVAGGSYWQRYLHFRDSLRTDLWLAGRYADLKHRLADRCGRDRDRYTAGKTGFVETVLATAAAPLSGARPG